MDREEDAAVIRDLLTIAKIPMPVDLFAIDPLVLNAQGLLAELEQQSSSTEVLRVPAIWKRDRKPPYRGRSKSAREWLDSSLPLHHASRRTGAYDSTLNNRRLDLRWRPLALYVVECCVWRRVHIGRGLSSYHS